MTKPVRNTYQEIITQPIAWRQALEVTRCLGSDFQQLWTKSPVDQVLFIGCGSTYYLSLAAASLFTEITGKNARAVPSGELFLYPKTYDPVGVSSLLVAISRSGTTTETIAAVERFQTRNSAPVVGITNYEESPLAQACDLTIAIPAGQERSVAQTRSFASMYIAAVTLAAHVAGREDLLLAISTLPDWGEKLITASHSRVKSLGERLDIDRFYFLGSGSRYGLACEANLKMKEMTLTHSEPFHFMEFRHGPMSMVKKQAAIIGLRSSINRKYEQAVLDDMADLGGNILSLAERDADLNFNSGLPEEIRNVLFLPPLQLMAFYRSIAKGLNPDQPKNLVAVVKLDLEEGERR